MSDNTDLQTDPSNRPNLSVYKVLKHLMQCAKSYSFKQKVLSQHGADSALSLSRGQNFQSPNPQTMKKFFFSEKLYFGLIHAEMQKKKFNIFSTKKAKFFLVHQGVL